MAKKQLNLDNFFVPISGLADDVKSPAPSLPLNWRVVKLGEIDQERRSIPTLDDPNNPEGETYLRFRWGWGREYIVDMSMTKIGSVAFRDGSVVP